MTPQFLTQASRFCALVSARGDCFICETCSLVRPVECAGKYAYMHTVRCFFLHLIIGEILRIRSLVARSWAWPWISGHGHADASRDYCKDLLHPHSHISAVSVQSRLMLMICTSKSATVLPSTSCVTGSVLSLPSPLSRFKIQDSRFKIQAWLGFKIQDSRFKLQAPSPNLPF